VLEIELYIMASTNGSNRASQAREWKAAQAIKLSVPSLAGAARQQLNFLARVHQDQGLTQAGLALDLAIYRYCNPFNVFVTSTVDGICMCVVTSCNDLSLLE
jgi:hypothetical protein